MKEMKGDCKRKTSSANMQMAVGDALKCNMSILETSGGQRTTYILFFIVHLSCKIKVALRNFSIVDEHSFMLIHAELSQT